MRNQIMADYVREPRARLFEKMIEEGTSTAPVQHWAQGLGNVSKALVGAYMAKKLKEEYEGKEGEAASERSLATQFAMGMPAETQTYGDTTINWNEQKPNFAKAAGVLKSPYNADFQGDIFNAQIQQNQTAANQEFLRQQQAQQFAQQRQLAEMTAQRQISAQDAMLNRQLELEKWKQENDPISKILASGGSPQLGQVIPQQQGVGASQVQAQGIPQINASELQPNAHMQQMPQQGIPQINPQLAIFNSALAAKGLKAPDGFMYAPKQGGGLDLVKAPMSENRKLSSTEQKELFDAMDLSQSGSAATNALSQAQNIMETKNPYTGFGAETLAAANRIPIVGGLISDERASATTDVKNLVTEQALNQLKAIFGGMPTEGERQILLQLQALPSYTPQEQKSILGRALQAAQNRQKFNEAKIRGIQTGEYRNPSFNPVQAGGQSQQVQQKVKVVSPQGKVGLIDQSELEQALANGWRQQ